MITLLTLLFLYLLLVIADTLPCRAGKIDAKLRRKLLNRVPPKRNPWLVLPWLRTIEEIAFIRDSLSRQRKTCPTVIKR